MEEKKNFPTRKSVGGILDKKSLNSLEKKIFLIISILCFSILIVGITYAYIAYYTNQKGINVLETDCVHIDMEDLSEGISLRNAYPLTDEQGYNTKPYRFRITNTCNIGVDYHVNIEVFDIANRMSSKNVAAKVDEFEKKILTSEISTTPTYTGDEGTSIESYNVYTNTLSPGESKSHDIRIWLDESAGNDSQNKEFKSKIVIEAIQNQIAQMTFSEYIIDQSKSQDRGIERIEHEATEQIPALTDYRYTGANPNNYVYFGCSENCTEENLYRIIGVIPTQSSENGAYENRVKLIKASEYIGPNAEDGSRFTPSGKGYKWNADGNNKWEESTLKEELNTEYWNSLEEYQKYIEPSKWYLGSPLGEKQSTYTSEQFYKEERSKTPGYSQGAISYIDNIGLMYPSDYGYSLEKKYREPSIYENELHYRSQAWLYNMEEKYYEWTITPENTSQDFVKVWVVDKQGRIDYYRAYYDNYLFIARPTFYLKSSIMYGGGLGTKEEPFQIIENSNRMSDYIIAKSTTDETIEKVSHEATEQTPTLTDYRYTGANPNNYVCFGYEGERCPDENLYRIIGVIPTQSSENGAYENRVKLIKTSNYVENESGYLENSIGPATPEGTGYRWNKDANINNWEESSLNTKVLNNIYWNSLGEYQKYIESSKWYLGSLNNDMYELYTVGNLYNVERSNVSSYSGGATFYISNIGLMYPSDYGYSISKEYWNNNSISNYQNEYIKNAWLYNLSGGEYVEWLISASHDFPNGSVSAWNIGYTGNIWGGFSVIYFAQVYAIRPTFYLKSSVLFRGGEGTIDNPYYLSI